MPQLHFSVTDEIAELIRARAAQAKQSVSRYVADMVKRDIGRDWPEGYFMRIAGAKTAAIIYAASGPPEERQPLK